MPRAARGRRSRCDHNQKSKVPKITCDVSDRKPAPTCQNFFFVQSTQTQPEATNRHRQTSLRAHPNTPKNRRLAAGGSIHPPLARGRSWVASAANKAPLDVQGRRWLSNGLRLEVRFGLFLADFGLFLANFRSLGGLGAHLDVRRGALLTALLSEGACQCRKQNKIRINQGQKIPQK